jgi:hypothetical protein
MDLPYQPNTPFSQSDHSTHQYNALRFFLQASLYSSMEIDFPISSFVIPNSSRYLIPPVIREYPNPLYASLGILLCFISAKNIFNSTCHYMMNSVIHLPKTFKNKEDCLHVWLHFVQICFLSSKIKYF